MFKGQIQTSNRRFKTRVSALNGAKVQFATIQRDMDDLHHEEVSKMMQEVIVHYQNLKCDQPYFISVEITSNPNGLKKEKIFEVTFNEKGKSKIIGWNKEIRLYPLDAELFESFLFEQTIRGQIQFIKNKINEALDQQNKEVFDLYAKKLRTFNDYLRK